MTVWAVVIAFILKYIGADFERGLVFDVAVWTIVALGVLSTAASWLLRGRLVKYKRWVLAASALLCLIVAFCMIFAR